MERDNETADDRRADSTTNDRAATDGTAAGSTAVGAARNDRVASAGLSRRNVLKTAGALGALAAGGALGTGSVTAAPNADPETIDAPYKIVLGDGDVLANKRIVANGSDVSIVARGNDWEIRNVGIEGEARSNPITVETSGGSGLIENVYVGGVASADETPIFVHREHSGTITIRNANVGNTSSSHGIYASAPGSTPERKPGGGGAVHIQECYAHDTGGNGFRIGSDGSYVRNSVAANCDNSGVWNQWERGRVENVAIEAGVNAFNVGANNYDNRDGECTLSVSNAEYDAPNEVRKADGIGDWDYYSASGLTRTSSPDLSPPGGVPMSAAGAAGSGGSGGSGGSSATSDGSDASDSAADSEGSDSSESSEGSDSEDTSQSEGSDDSDSGGSEEASGSAGTADVTASESNDGPVEYELRTDGTFYGSKSEDSNDGVSSGGSRASGKVWPGFTDTFSLDGAVTDVTANGDVTVEADGETIDAGGDDAATESDDTESDSSDADDGDDSDSDSEDADSEPSESSDSSDDGSDDEDRSLIVEGAGSTTNGPRDYRVVVTGTVTDLEGNPDDSVSGGDTVNGKVWAPFTDRYAFSGEIDSFETDGDVTVRVDGETVDPDSL